MTTPVLATWRALRVAEHVLTGALILVAVATWRRLGRPCEVTSVVAWWHRRLCRAMGLRIERTGVRAPAALLVANHISWLDIPSIGGQGPIAFLSKSEVRRWPLVGWMSNVVGTLFIERGASQASALIANIGASIRSGRSVVVFPEGTTSDGVGLRHFHPRLFAAAQQPGIVVQPVAIRYGSNAEPDMMAPFIGNDSLLPHLLRVLRHPGLRVTVSFLSPLDATGSDRRALAEQARTAIATALGIDPDDDKAAARPRAAAR